VATVVFSRGQQEHTGGLSCVEVAPGSVRDVIRELVQRFPALEGQLEVGVAVSIDGEIIQEPLLEQVSPSSELHFLPSISGGA